MKLCSLRFKNLNSLAGEWRVNFEAPEYAGGLGLCSACFSGKYPTDVTNGFRKNRFERKLSDASD